MPELLSVGTELTAVTLHVGDLSRMGAYYRDALGLTVLQDGGGVMVLGRRTTPVVVLRHTPGLPVPGRHQAGLFHTAVLFDGEADLAAAVVAAARHPESHYVGSADHLVSNAFYFTDPEGNGIELYADRDRSVWQYRDGRIQMASLALDPSAFVDEHLTEQAMTGIAEAHAKVGHVHLQVGDIAGARDFYVETLGFETTAEVPGALFVSVGGYHHHLAMNTWNSSGAGPRASTLGLGEIAAVVPSQDDLGALADRLRHRGFQVQDDGASLRTQDPWRNAVTVSAQQH
ncbi:MAG: Glyoxalase [Actinotalea sp.]|nr:Glyoxalase [Actinotalea sp.]